MGTGSSSFLPRNPLQINIIVNFLRFNQIPIFNSVVDPDPFGIRIQNIDPDPIK